MKDLNALAQRLTSDPAFVKELVADPEETLKRHDFEVSEEILNTMKGMDESELMEMASNYSVDKAAC
jgi:hypothetical protein